MEKKEILALIAAVSAVFLLIFVMTKVRGGEEPPSGDITVEPGDVVVTGEPSETDIWDVLHAMNTTAPEIQEPVTVQVTALGDDGQVYVLTDADGNAQTELVQQAAPAEDVSAETETTAENGQPAEIPSVNVTPEQQNPADQQAGDGFFVVIPADQ